MSKELEKLKDQLQTLNVRIRSTEEVMDLKAKELRNVNLPNWKTI